MEKLRQLVSVGSAGGLSAGPPSKLLLVSVGRGLKLVSVFVRVAIPNKISVECMTEIKAPLDIPRGSTYHY